MEQTIGKNVVVVAGQEQKVLIAIHTLQLKQQPVQQQEHNKENVIPVEK